MVKQKQGKTKIGENQNRGKLKYGKTKIGENQNREGGPGGIRLSVDSTTFSEIFYNLQQDTKYTTQQEFLKKIQILQFYDI